MPKKFLNVEYSVYKTRINVTNMQDLSELQDAIKAKLGEAIPVAPALIQLYSNSNRDQLINTWALLRSLSEEYFTEGGSCVVVVTSPPPQGMGYGSFNNNIRR